MSNISVIIYSYKGKILKEIVENLINKSSKENHISISIFDQNPLLREDGFRGFKNTSYRHIFWDHITSPIKYKDQVISESTSDFILILSDNILLGENWDKQLIDNIKNDSMVISGKNKPVLSYYNIFSLIAKTRDSESFELSNYIDRDLIFGKTKTLKQIKLPTYLKYNGEEETISIEYFCNGIDIYSCPGQFYSNVGEHTLKKLYTTFSKDHNYNEFVNLFKFENNRYTDIKNKIRSIDDFCSWHNLDRAYLKPLPYPDTDVSYDPHNMIFDEVDAKKFMTKINYIS